MALPLVCLAALGLSVSLAAGGCKQSEKPSSNSATEPSLLKVLPPPEASTSSQAPPPPTKSHQYDADYEFTQDWFSSRVPLWEQFVAPLEGQPIAYLEVGLFEGRSALWMLENVLTHADSRLVGIDPFSGERRDRYLKNVTLSGASRRVKTIVGYSQQELTKLPPESFDVIYIDGSHLASSVLSDAVLSWSLLKTGGLLIFDDYGWRGYPDEREAPPTPNELRPKLAIDAFISANRYTTKVLHRDWLVFLEKGSSACGHAEGCTPIGSYKYHWWSRSLIHAKTGERLELRSAELGALEELLHSVPHGHATFAPSAELRSRATFQSLSKRLGLTF